MAKPTEEEIAKLRELKKQEIIPEGLSKNEWKRQQKAKKKEELKIQNKELLKEKKKEQRKRKRQRILEDEEYRLSLKKPTNQIESGVKIIIDCQFDSYMSEKEIISLSNQIRTCYSAMRHCKYNLPITVTSFNNRLKERYENKLSEYVNWQGIEFKSESIEELLENKDNKDKMVYLTPDTEEDVMDILPDYTYIIGGIIDKNRHPKLCLNKAKELGIKVGRLPIGQYINLNGRNVLVTNHVYQLLFSSIHSLHSCLDIYKQSDLLNLALDSIDLTKIYNIEDSDTYDNYDDLIVKQLLKYFKNDFFKWVNTPECDCGGDVESLGSSTPPPNKDQISIIEHYKCIKCGKQLEFPRINNPATLLITRKGRCGEFVNCFLLILSALIGIDRVRYLWNYEDHVWCEYYSSNLKKWVHLDPCEGAFDEPLLYCDNWGKQMSFVIGFGDKYIIDLSEKYITKEKQINKSTITDVNKVKQVINYYNTLKQLNYQKQFEGDDESLMRVYYDIIVPYNQELKHVEPTKTNNLPIGRQTGSIEWLKSRGESG
ncbi:unnamed protein product [Candida verbasci]|uniref:tRNA (guanine(9)-N1)-methyltransferase n=1 Tax=Candida verbasci TaxID=1227364 RepID=A0A9W4TWL3_9ASCO|nr:unnamed protein product [Candida verbasci]